MRISAPMTTLPPKTRQPGDVVLRFVRPPYAREFIPCTCDAVDKDDCGCIRAWLNARLPAA